MPLLNLNIEQNIYIQVYTFVQVPCIVLPELSKNASSNHSLHFLHENTAAFQTFTGNDKSPFFAVPSFPSHCTGKKPQIICQY